MVYGSVGTFIDEKGNLSEEVKATPRSPQMHLDMALEEFTWYIGALSKAK
jgi:hypothetical protein